MYKIVLYDILHYSCRGDAAPDGGGASARASPEAVRGGQEGRRQQRSHAVSECSNAHVLWFVLALLTKLFLTYSSGVMR